MKTRIRATAVLGLPAVVGMLPAARPRDRGGKRRLAAAGIRLHGAPRVRGARARICGVPGAGAGAEDGCGARAHPSAGDHARARRSCPRSKDPTPGEGVFGLRPQDLHSIYALPTTAASTQTIALVDAYNDLSAEADLNVYDKEFGLARTRCMYRRERRCFEQVNQKGQNAEAGNLPFPASTVERAKEEAICKTKAVTKKAQEAREAACKEVEEADGWAEEISLDIEVSHATCQSCKIVLVEANSASFEDLEEAEKTAAKLGATEISNSWGGPEQGMTARLDDKKRLQRPWHRDHRCRRGRWLPGLGRRTRRRKRLRRLSRLLPTRGRGRRHPPAGPARPR